MTRIIEFRAPLWRAAAAHGVNDLYQGVIPALVVFLVSDRGISYVAAGGIVLANTLLSSIVQPLFGVIADRYRLPSLAWAGLAVSAIGIGLAGLFDAYWAVWCAVALSGVGVAAFHPEATRLARSAAGGTTRGLSVFSVGGNLGLATGPVIAAGVFAGLGVSGTWALAIPGLLMAAYCASRRDWTRAGLPGVVASDEARAEIAANDWAMFWRLLGIIILRSIATAGFTSFLALYLVNVRGTSEAVGATMVTVVSMAGVVGTLAGGWLADKWGRLKILRFSYAATPVLLVGVLLAPSVPLIVVASVALGLVMNVPFVLHVALGHAYLPQRIGTASGATLGLSLTVGGIFAPIMGSMGDMFGLQILMLIPATMMGISFFASFALRLRPGQ